MRYISFSTLQAKLDGRSRESIYRDLDADRLPKPVKLGGRLYWVEEHIDDFLVALANQAQSDQVQRGN